MSKEDLLIERLVNRIQNANTDILKVIGNSINKIGKLKPSDIYLIQQQLKYGENLEKIIKILDKMTMLNRKDIVDILEAVAKKDQEFAKVYYEAKNKIYIPFEENISLQQKLTEIKNVTLEAYRNISSTNNLIYLDRFGNKISKPIVQAYWQVIDDAVINVSMGKETFQEAMKKQIRMLASNGIQSIEDSSGRKMRLDSAIRMNMQDALKEMTIAQQEIIGEQFDYDAMEVSVHEYPAPDHEDIQGHIFNLDNWKLLQDYTYIGEIKDINGKTYLRDGGNPIRPIGVLNCRHSGYATVKGVKPRYSQEQLNEINKNNKKGFKFDGKEYTMYEGTQLQRQMELEMRKTKDIKDMAVASGEDNAKEVIEQSNKKLRQLSSKYTELCRLSGLTPYRERARIVRISDVM